ncbi:hypothetical protein HU200_048766 [Digitaria exilis]|uniref:Protein kinase domain-containing protein n=1 Tax=Digitaria exilis TaxID=1010633 RepID=A0A835AZY6_9POAL|nr:hypothetical protein HU200_048766 [Digitaria exilis]
MWPLLGNAATVVQLTGVDPLGLINMIRQAAQTAKQNKADCEHLARRTDELVELVTILRARGRVEPEAARTLAALDETLVEAHQLVVSCQGHGFMPRLFKAGRNSDKFKDVYKKLDACLRNFPLISHIIINRRLDAITMATNNGGGGCGAPRLDTTSTTTTAMVVAEEDSAAAHGVEVFTLAEVTVATDNFAVMLGAGDSGTVYKGTLHDGRHVAVKRLNRSVVRRGAEDAFGMELAILAPLRHHHIVRLLGRCAEDGDLIVVTELMTNGSLHDHLHGHRHSSPVTLTWKARVEVLLGAARGVEHLHRRAVPLVIHGGVSSSHVLLGDDDSWAGAPRLTGFAASVWRAAGVDSQPVTAIAGAGAYGYADPEFLCTGRIKPGSDVYGLGVVMLEVLTGKPPVMSVWDERAQSTTAPVTLVSFALPSVEAGRLVDVLDRRPVVAPAPWQLEPLEMVAAMAARCLCLHGDNRPGISEVVVNLERALQLICTRGNF